MKKKAVLFRCANCIADMETKKNAGEISEITLADGTIFQFDEVEIIEVGDSFKCSECGSIVKDIILDDTYGEKPWKLFKQNGEPTDLPSGGKNYRMSIVDEYDTYENALAAYEKDHKEEGKAARINLRGGDQMIVVCVIDPNGERSFPIQILKQRIKKEEEK